MKKVFPLFLAALCLGLMGIGPPHFPGDGYPNPDAFSVSGHGPALSYTDKGDGTFTDNVTKFMWEKKDSPGGGLSVCPGGPTCDNPHDVDNLYTWTGTVNGVDPDGTVFTVFLHALNKTCEGEGEFECDRNNDCALGEKCGFAGHRDWCLPHLKKLLSLVDYSQPLTDGVDVFLPPGLAVHPSLPGDTSPRRYWTATTFPAEFILPGFRDVRYVEFAQGSVNYTLKGEKHSVRAVRPCT